jgi:hypothetical protein
MRPMRVREEPAPAYELALAVSEGPAVDVQRRQEAADVAGVARCPVCATELVLRMGRHGPTFSCRCRGGSRNRHR